MKQRHSIFRDARGKTIHKPRTAPITWRVSAYAFVKKGSKALIIKDAASGQWEFPGGGIEPYETIAEGLQRECYEETGYKVRMHGDPIYINDEFFYNHKNKKFYHSVCFVCYAKLTDAKQHAEVINTVEPDEILDVRWSTVKDIPLNQWHPIFRPFIKRINL